MERLTTTGASVVSEVCIQISDSLRIRRPIVDPPSRSDPLFSRSEVVMPP